MKLRYLITGTGRCGTVFAARFLTSLGIPCGHESVFDWRGIAWAEKVLGGHVWPQLSYASTSNLRDGKWVPEPVWLEDETKIEAESSYMAAPFLDDSILKEVPVIHLVRDPKKVIHSFCHHIDYFTNAAPSNLYEQFMHRYIPELGNDMPQYDRASLFYVRWNQMIEKSNPALFYKVEDGPDKLKAFIDKDGKHYSDTSANTYKKWSKDTFGVHMVQDSSIRQELIDLGRRYGYRMTTALI